MKNFTEKLKTFEKYKLYLPVNRTYIPGGISDMYLLDFIDYDSVGDDYLNIYIKLKQNRNSHPNVEVYIWLIKLLFHYEIEYVFKKDHGIVLNL